jgi:hypothetical protein
MSGNPYLTDSTLLPKFLLPHVISPFIFANLTLKPCLEAVLASASALHFDVNDPSQSSGPIASSPSPPGSTPLSSEDGSMGQVAVAMLTSTGHCSFLLPIERSHSLVLFMPFPSSTHHHMFSATLFPVPFSTIPFESNCRSIHHACSRQPNHRRTRQVSVIICVIATEVSYPHPLFYRTISYTHTQPSIRASDPWLLYAGLFASLHAPVSRFPQILMCFSADRIEMLSQVSLPNPGKNQHQRQGFSSPLLRRQQPTFSNILFFFFLSYVFQLFVLSALHTPLDLTSTRPSLLFPFLLYLFVCLFLGFPNDFESQAH